MKNTSVLLLLLFTVAFFSCSKEEMVEQSDEMSENLDEKMLHELLDQFNPLDPCDAFEMYICVDECVLGTAWQCAVEAAVNAFNNLPRHIWVNMNLVYNCDALPAGESIDVNIGCDDLDGATAETFIRTVFNASSDIFLDNGAPTDWNCDEDPIADCCQLKRTVMHELGHALGFGHSVGFNSLPTTYIAGTDPSDENSMFVAGGVRDFCEDRCAFSAGDIQALGILYPVDCACCGPVVTPTVHPIDFDGICYEDKYGSCYDFGRNNDCIRGVEISSNYSKLLVSVQGTKVCLTSIHPREETVELTVKILGFCGDGQTETWTIKVNSRNHCGGAVDPPNDGGTNPPSGGGPTEEDCIDDPCPCHVNEDCPPGWKCIGGGGAKFCIPT